MSITRIGTTQRWSDAVIFNGAVYLVEVPATLEADLTEQTRELLQLVEDGLVKYGSDKSRIISVTIYLSDITQIAEFNAIWDHWLPTGSAPVRACVQAQLAHAEYKVEIQLVAALTE
jgi:enamine deaminase RidA (YjgF/YER057c/UK114 family)